MILASQQIRQVLATRARELRFSYHHPNPPEVEAGQVHPVRSAPGKDPVFWIQAGCQGKCDGKCEGRGWYPDDEAEEYVIEFRKVAEPDRPRLLAPKARTGDGHGYTTVPALAMHGEPEAVDQRTQDRITKEGWAGFNQREKDRHRLRRLMALEERLRLAWGDGQRLRIDLSDELKLVDRAVRVMERKTDQTRPD